MENVYEKKSGMTEIIDCPDLGSFSDWESFTDDIDIEQLLQITESHIEGEQNEEDRKFKGISPPFCRLEVFDVQENNFSPLSAEVTVSSKVFNINQNNISSEKNGFCKNITLLKENFSSEGMFFLSEENFDSQKMIVSSQESSDGQRMIISSQETSDSQRMITSSQESSSSEKMIISSQEFSDSQKMITSSQDISDSQKMIISSQENLDQRVIISGQESFGSQKRISSQSFGSEIFLISNQVPEDQKVIPSSQETSVKHKMFNTRSGGFLKISKKINLKTEYKSNPSIRSRLSLKDKKLQKFLEFKGLEGAMTTQYNSKEFSVPASIGKIWGNVKESKIFDRELKVKKIKIGMNKQNKFISSRR